MSTMFYDGDGEDDSDILNFTRIAEAWKGTEVDPDAIDIPVEECIPLWRPWRRALIIKVLGKNVSFPVLLQNLHSMWCTFGELDILALELDYYVVKFRCREDYETALTKGPWSIQDHYLVVFQWRPFFQPSKQNTLCTLTWVRFYGIPHEFFNSKDFLMKLIKCVGKLIRIDTSLGRARYVRACVEINLHQVLRDSVVLNGNKFQVEYENMQMLCFGCGRFGHKKHECLNLQNNTTQGQNSDEQGCSEGNVFVGENLREAGESVIQGLNLASKNLLRRNFCEDNHHSVGMDTIHISSSSDDSALQEIDNEQHASKRAKGPLPPSFQHNNGVENMGGNVFRDRRGSYFQTTRGISTTSGNSYRKDQFDIPSDVMHENRGNRVPPQSMAPGRSANSNGFGNASEPSQNRGMGEERPGADERQCKSSHHKLGDINQSNTEANLPEGLLSVPLLRHQKIALAWMIKREREGRNCLGGILADDQGLGKTISMIAIILMHRSLQAEWKSENLRSSKAEALNMNDKQKEKVVVDDITVASEEGRSLPHTKPAAGTLVVCPASVLRQWNRELEEKVTEEAKLSVLIYHGGNRTKDPVELAKYDVVLTTYAIVNIECPKQPSTDEDDNEGKKSKNAPGEKKGKKRKLEGDASDICCGTIAKVRWFRVILDEAETIKNHSTQVARACFSLLAKRRWCLSGTPIQAIEELFSYFRFLEFEPYCKYKTFHTAIKLPISRDSVKGYQKLLMILRSFVLRRTKETVIDGKPIISAEERVVLESGNRKQFKQQE